MNNENIIVSDINCEMRGRYIDYAMNVIVDRALPDVRDGLKPVHRRILYAMYLLSLVPDKPYRKCARIVGDVLGKYHPHADTGVYDALVRMAQDFSIRYTLVDGHGNYGSVDGDGAAAMRYTEARMTNITTEMLNGIAKDTVDFMPNFDGEEQEPRVLPSRLPNLLANGSEGIAVGMTTAIPSHNLTEVINGIIYLIDNQYCTISDLIKYIPAPDFPTNATIINPKDMLEIYTKGEGKIVVRSKYHIENTDKFKQIVFTEIPYQVNKAKICESIVDLVAVKKDNVLKPIVDVRDESDREGMRIVVEIKKIADENIILARLFAKTKLQDNYNAIFRAIVNNEPKILNLKQILEYYVNHQKDVLTRRTNFDLDKAQRRLHILEGLIKAILDLDKTIELIKTSKSISEAKERLVEYLSINEKQAQAILDLKLQRLTGLEIKSLENEYKEITKTVEYLNSILNNENELLDMLKTELLEIKDKYGDERRTKLIYDDEIKEVSVDELIEQYNCRIIYTQERYIKKLLKSSDKQYLKDNDEIIGEISSTNKSTLLFFTNKQNRYRLPCHQLDTCTPSALGTYIPNILNLEPNEQVIKVFSIDEERGYILSVFANGKLSKIDIKSYMSNYTKLNNCYSNDSELIDINYIEKDIDILLLTEEGKMLIIDSSQVGNKGTRSSQGNTAINTESKVIAAIIDVNKDMNFNIKTEKGKEVTFYLDDVAPTGKANEERTLYTYCYGNVRNKGNYIYYNKTDKIISFTLNK